MKYIETKEEGMTDYGELPFLATARLQLYPAKITRRKTGAGWTMTIVAQFCWMVDLMKWMTRMDKFVFLLQLLCVGL